MIPSPRQILAVGRNYAAHAAELGHDVPDNPLLFWKPIGSLARDGVCHLPRWAEGPTNQHYEGEVVLVLGRDLGPGSPPLPADPWDAVACVSAGLDLSDRDLQKLEPQWVRAKGFADACALGELRARPSDPTAIEVATFKNGEEVQRGSTELLLFPFRELLTYLHGFLRLYAGDAIFTGTPAGVGAVAPGDTLQVVVSAAGQEASTLEVLIAVGPTVAPFPRA